MKQIKGQLLFLGTGGSMGIPVIGCSCPVCNSETSYNKRFRSSALVKIDGRHLLIDCGPDFKMQALKYQLNSIDGILFTHAHHDHTAGIDELRVYSLRSHHPIPCLLSEATSSDLLKRFYYIFDKESQYTNLTAKFNFQLLEGERGKTVFQGIEVSYFSYEQGGMAVNGFRFGDLAYVTDICSYPKTIFEDLKGVHHLVLSALRFSSSAVHFNIDQAIDFARRAGAQKTWLMHIAHEIDHEKAKAYLPSGIQLAYDGLELEFSGS